jgi:hypothetical protein
MKRQAIRGLVLIGLLAAALDGRAAAQNVADKVTVRDRKDGATKTYEGTLTVSAAGFQVVNADKKAVGTFAPDDVVKLAVGDLPGVDRGAILALNKAEEERKWDAARAGYAEQLKKPALADRSKRYLEFKRALMTSRIADETDADKGWKELADKAIQEWTAFLPDAAGGWEVWPAVRACTRLQAERGKFDDAARAWARVAKNDNLPPDARAEAALQETDFQIRGKVYSGAATSAADQLKTAVGAKKDRLTIYELAAKAGSDGKWADGVAKIKAEMNKTKDPTVHSTGYSMMGELYLADGKPRDAMWMFLWVETVLNQDREEAFKAIVRLHDLFAAQMDEEQTKKYQDKLKRFRSTF